MIGRAKRYKEVDIPVIDGTAYLPDGRTVECGAQVLRIPVMTGDRMYERIKKWRAEIKLSGAIRYDEEAVMRGIVQKLDGPLVSSRGARYIPFGPVVFGGISETGDDFMRNELTATGWRMARYVRPGAR